MDDLEQMIRPKKFHGKSVDLLCLSACRTASGDDRASLGLAGAAIKSGARSVLASLWYINDKSTSLIMRSFHHELNQNMLKKCKALQTAQLNYLKSNSGCHAHEWAALILIGDWR